MMQSQAQCGTTPGWVGGKQKARSAVMPENRARGQFCNVFHGTDPTEDGQTSRSEVSDFARNRPLSTRQHNTIAYTINTVSLDTSKHISDSLSRHTL